MNSKGTGNVGEAKVLSTLVEMGVPVYMQFGDNESADYIIVVHNIPYKVQVKTSSSGDDDKVKFYLCSSTIHRKNGVKHPYTIEEVDMFMCYDCRSAKIFLIQNLGDMTGLTIRYTKPKSNQSIGIRFANDYALSIKTLQEVSQAILLEREKAIRKL